MARSRVFDGRKGVWPGTMAILSFSGPIGTTSACLLSSVPWSQTEKPLNNDTFGPASEPLALVRLGDWLRNRFL